MGGGSAVRPSLQGERSMPSELHDGTMAREGGTLQVQRIFKRWATAAKSRDHGPCSSARKPGPREVRAAVALGLRGKRPGLGVLRGHRGNPLRFRHNDNAPVGRVVAAGENRSEAK